MLRHEGFLDDDDLATLRDACGDAPGAFAKAVLTVGLMDEDELARFLSERTHHKVAPKDLLAERETDVASLLTPHLMRELEVVPIRRVGRFLTVAMLDPTDKCVIRQIEFFTGYRVKPVIAAQSHIDEALKRIFDDYTPRSSPLEGFLQNHLEGAVRRFKVNLGPVSPPAAPPPARAGGSRHAAPSDDTEPPAVEETAAEEPSLGDASADALESTDLAASEPSADVPATEPPLLADEPMVAPATSSEQDPNNILDTESPAGEAAAPPPAGADPIDNSLGGLDTAFDASATPPADEAAAPPETDAPLETSDALEESPAIEMSDSEAPAAEVSAEPSLDAPMDDLLATGETAADASLEVAPEEIAPAPPADGLEPGLDLSSEIAPSSELPVTDNLDINADDPMAEEPSLGDIAPGEELAPEPMALESSEPVEAAETAAPPPALEEDDPTSLAADFETLDDEEVWLADTMAFLNRTQIGLSLMPPKEKAFADLSQAMIRAGAVRGAVWSKGPQASVFWSAWGDQASADASLTKSLASLVSSLPEGQWSPAPLPKDSALSGFFETLSEGGLKPFLLRTPGPRELWVVGCWDERGSSRPLLMEATADLLRRAAPMGG
jgi:hypothetical protein